MIRKIQTLFTLMLFSLFISVAQDITFSYDAAGNRIKREITLNSRNAPQKDIDSFFSDVFSAWKTSKWSGMDHKERWFETNASKLGADHFDKYYGSRAPGYIEGSADFFDKKNFSESTYTPYINPRLGDGEQDKPYPIHHSKLVIWDFIIL